jgi:SAM-dependent methyltransferase
MTRIHKKGAHAHEDFDKYDYYRRAVQSAESDVEFYSETYKELKGRLPKVFREDFCGTYALSCEWVKLNKNFKAIGVDLDPEPLAYGHANYHSKLRPEQAGRISIYEKDVLSLDLPKADIILAANFSYYVFKTRDRIKEYFTNAKKTLNKDGLFILDCFGGSHCHDENEESTRLKEFTYYWHQASFDPISNRAQFYIHFRPHGKKRIERAFSYDWRMWTIPELKDVLEEIGFPKVHVYWEGTKKNGSGNGIFKRTSVGEPCLSWIAYIVCES